MYVLDTNIFLRTLAREDEQTFLETQALLQLIKNGEIKAIVPGVVLTELVWTLASSYQQDRKSIASAVESVINLNGLNINDDYQYQQALEWYQSKKIKFVDCLIASMPLVVDYDWTVISYDREFGKLPVNWKKPIQVCGSIN